jgi:DNA modification methylase
MISKKSFPWRKHNKTELMEDYNNLKKNIENVKKSSTILNKNVGRKCSNVFFQYERMKTRSQNKISCYDFWNKKKSTTIAKYMKTKSNSNDVFAAINFLNHCPSQFPPFTACQIYKYFNAKKVLDPFAGWGDRCIAAMSMDVDYTGIDSNTHLKPAYSKMIKYFPSKSRVKMIYKRCETVNLDNIDFDFVLTSPPYWRKKDNLLLEEYHNTEKDYDKFIQNTLSVFIEKCLQKDNKIWVCINMPSDMYDDVKKITGPCKKKIKFNSYGAANKGKSSKTNSIAHKKQNYIYCF